MTNILSVLKKAVLLGSRFVILKDIIAIPTEFLRINGNHCIEHGFQFIPEEFNDIQYTSADDIIPVLKELTDSKGISKITLIITEDYINISLQFKTELGDMVYNIANSSSCNNMCTKHYKNIYEVLYNSNIESQILNDEQLLSIVKGKVIELKDHHEGGIVRISKNLFPCIGVVKKGTVPNMVVCVKTYTKNENNILALLVSYKDMKAAHVYYYDPIIIQ